MAKKKQRRAAPARRRRARRSRSSGGAIVRVVRPVAVARRRRVGGSPKKDLVGPAISAAAGVAFALVDSKKPQYSVVKGIPLPLLYGAAAVVLGTMVRQTARGDVGRVLRETGSAGLTLGAYKLTLAKMGPAVAGADGPIVGFTDEN